MIILAIGIIVIAMFALALFATYDEERTRVTEAEETASQNENDRVREEIDPVFINGTVTISNEWLGETQIMGIIVECDNGTRLTAPYEATTSNYNGTKLMELIGDLEGRC